MDAAENDPHGCHVVNADAVKHLADACRQYGCKIVHVSTDYVFGADRSRRMPYTEADTPGPLNAYGRSKLAGEVAARSTADHLIVRTCGLYSVGEDGPAPGRNFLDTMLLLSRQHAEMKVVADQICTPSYVPHIAQGILALIAADASGTFHLTNTGETSWADLARKLFELAGKTTAVKAIRSAEYASVVDRPGYSVLNTTKFESVSGVRLPTWHDAVAAYVNTTLEKNPCSLSS